MSGLSTEHVVLGLLVERKGYGYDLVQRARERFAFLGLSENFVYKALRRLEEDGSIESSPEAPGVRGRRAERVWYRATRDGRTRFKRWIATPGDRTVLYDEMQVKLSLSEPEDLPELLEVAMAESSRCMAELEGLRRPVLGHVAAPEVPWAHASALLVDDLNLRLLQALVDWLDNICEVIEERIDALGPGGTQR